MYKDLVEVAKKIVAVAITREENVPQRTIRLSDIGSLELDDTYDKQLTEILMSLQTDEVLALETIMYLGRDKDYESGLTADEIFWDYKKYIQSLVGNEKELGVRQMVEKIPLGEYLTDGYAILGITL